MFCADWICPSPLTMLTVGCEALDPDNQGDSAGEGHVYNV